MACDIILLKISFENSINLGGENTPWTPSYGPVLSILELDLDAQEIRNSLLTCCPVETQINPLFSLAQRLCVSFWWSPEPPSNTIGRGGGGGASGFQTLTF